MANEVLMDDQTFRDLNNRWCRGIDWVVTKVSDRHWRILGYDYPELFTTKKAAYERATSMVLTQSRLRQAAGK